MNTPIINPCKHNLETGMCVYCKDERAKAEIEFLTEENRRLQAALEKYGQHDTYIFENGEEYPCPFTRVGGPCKCGFDEALNPTTQKEANK